MILKEGSRNGLGDRAFHRDPLVATELARANGFNQVVNGLGMTVSILIAGWIAETIGVANTVMLGSGIGVIGIFPLMTRHLLGIREEPAGRDEEVLQAAG